MQVGEASTRLKVFISYARSDSSDFAQDLLVGLELLGFEPFLDKHDIAAGEDWETRLSALIKAADTVVYVITPNSVKSERCSWEIGHSVAQSKRIIPVVAIPVPEADVPFALKRLNYIFFDQPHSFARSISQLSQALKADLNWVREHTRLGELATRWQERDRPEELLLRGNELQAAQRWLREWKPGAPDVTGDQRTFIAASAEAEAARQSKERQQLEEFAKAQSSRAEALAEREAAVKLLSRRTTVGLVGAGGLTALAAGLAYWGVNAEERFRAERKTAEEAKAREQALSIDKEAMRTDIEGGLTAYAAAKGSVAFDATPGSKNSPFTQALMKELANPVISFQGALAIATGSVALATANKLNQSSGGSQRPYFATDLNGSIFLAKQPESRRRKALIVAVDSLPKAHSNLATPKEDARVWKSELEATGFETTLLENPTREELLANIWHLKFDGDSRRGAIENSLVHLAGLVPIAPTIAASNTLIFFYYTGFGFSIAGDSYITPSDVDATGAESLKQSAVRVTQIENDLQSNAAARIMVFDTGFPEIEIPSTNQTPVTGQSPAPSKAPETR